ncbi:hypothetical protein AMECASPLE_026821, partial [Ameca splendens]
TGGSPRLEGCALPPPQSIRPCPLITGRNPSRTRTSNLPTFAPLLAAFSGGLSGVYFSHSCRSNKLCCDHRLICHGRSTGFTSDTGRIEDGDPSLELENTGGGSKLVLVLVPSGEHSPQPDTFYDLTLTVFKS